MRVNPQLDFEIIYSIIEHEKLGMILVPYVVQKNERGFLTLTHQRIYPQTADLFITKITTTDRKAIELLDNLTEDSLYKKFYTSTLKKKMKVKDFFGKHFDEKYFAVHIRKYIEKIVSEVFLIVDKERIYATGKDKNPASKKIMYSENISTVLFHFRRNENGTIYFATIKNNNTRIDFVNRESKIIVTNPAWLLVENELYHFEKNFDGQKLIPFLTKKFIHIKPEAEEKYFKTFVVPLLERFDVYAEGFEIVTESIRGNPILTLQQWGNDLRFNLGFKYGKEIFNYQNKKRVHVSLQKINNSFRFLRIRRSSAWEESRKNFLIENGLTELESSLFENKKLLQWTQNNLRKLKENGFEIHQNLDRKYFFGEQEMRLEIKEKDDWFDVYAIVRFGEFEIAFSQLKKYILARTKEFFLPNGDVAVIPEEWFTQLNPLIENDNNEGENIHIKKQHFGLLEALWQNDDKRKDEWKKKFSKIFISEEEPLPTKFLADMRTYQQQGYQWFYFLKKNNFGGILADDMGLGKTVQTLALLTRELEIKNDELRIKNENSEGTINVKKIENHQQNIFTHSESIIHHSKLSLVVVPTSLVFNWENEGKKFAPHLKILSHVGQFRNRDLSTFFNYDIILTTYGVLRSDDDIFKEIEFDYIILDESQSIKNPQSVTYKSVMKLRAKHKITLTGTPVENSINDLWSQMNFVNPGLLGNYYSFQENFVSPIEKLNDVVKTNQLQALVKPFILRRTKELVAADLPPKIEQIRLCVMNDEQQKLYETTKSFYRNELLKSIEEKTFTKNKFSFLQGLMKLRQLSNHPILTDEMYSGGSGKFDDVISQVNTALAEHHKIIMFSQFVKHLEIYKKYFDENNINYEYLDGSTAQNDRKNIVQRFQKSDENKLFLISLKAGGLGLNLTSADYVFLLDPWWNPAVERQAQDRSHRIGQNKNVFVYKFISKDSIEEKIVQLQERKKYLAESIISSEENLIKKISAEELLGLMR